MGQEAAPKIFTLLSEAIHYIGVNNFGINNLLFLLDDFLSIASPDSNGQHNMTLLKQLFGTLNIPIHPDKTVGPTTKLTFLGIDLDSILMQASLPPEKVDRIRDIIEMFLNRKTVTKRELQSLLGHFNYASRVIVQGRSFVSYLLSLLSAAKEQHHHIALSSSCRRDLNMWVDFLKGWNHKSFFYDLNITTSADLELYTDASGSIGYGGFFGGKWFATRWPETLKLGVDEVSIAFMELVPIVACAVLWGNSWSNKRILFHCDNISTVHIINKGRSSAQNIMRLMRKLTWCALNFNFTIHATHIIGKQNLIGDFLSRFQIEKFKKLVPYADPAPTPSPPLDHLYLD